MARAEAEIAIQGVKATGEWESGRVISVTITNGGSGYSSATVAFSGGGGTGATGTVSISGNAVASVTITAAGSGYTSVPTVTFSGDGTGATGTASIAGHILYVPITSSDAFRAGFIEPVAGKVMNDASKDDSTNLTTVPLVADLSGGAYSKIFEPDKRRFWTPAASGTSDTLTTGPLAWTAAPERAGAPLMCGAGWTATDGNFVFKEFTDFLGDVYALDYKNWRVWKRSGTKWTHYSSYGSAGWRNHTGTITGAVSNGGPNLIRITSASHSLVTGCFVDVSAVGGVSAATGRWKVTRIDDNTLDLQGSTFSGTYTGGGVWYLSGGAGTITGVANNGSGAVRITSVGHGLITDESVTVYGVLGATGANGTRLVTRVTADTFDLQGSTFGGAYTSGGEWAVTGLDAVGLTAPPTEIYSRGDTNSQMLLVGQGTDSDSTTYAKYSTTGTSWASWQVNSTDTNAQHFCQVGKRMWYSTGHTLMEAANTNPRTQRIGEKNRDIRRLLWYGDKILISKNEGLFEYDPRDRTATIVYDAPNKSAWNGRALVLHNGSAWCSFEQALIEYDLSSVEEHTLFLQEGENDKPFYAPEVLGAMSSGKLLYLVVRISTAETTPNYNYYLVIFTGRAGGYHPVFLSTTTASPSWLLEGSAVYWYGNRLYYSLGRDSSYQADTGWIHTDGEFPLSETTSNTYTTNVAIDLGEITLGRDTLDKLFKEIRYSLVDQADSAGGKVKFYYRLPADSSWTLIGESSAGTQTNTTMSFAATAPSLQGLVTENIRIKIELTNTDSTPNDAWYLSNAHLVCLITHDIAYQCSFTAWLRDDLDEPRPYIKEKILDGLIGAVTQPEPVYLTDLFGKSYYGTMRPDPGGLQVDAYDSDEMIYRDASFGVIFQENR